MEYDNVEREVKFEANFWCGGKVWDEIRLSMIYKNVGYLNRFHFLFETFRDFEKRGAKVIDERFFLLLWRLWIRPDFCDDVFFSDTLSRSMSYNGQHVQEAPRDKLGHWPSLSSDGPIPETPLCSSAINVSLWLKPYPPKKDGKDMKIRDIPISAVSDPTLNFSCSFVFGWEASSCNLADNLSVRASTTGPKTVARSFALLRLDTLARTLFAIILIRDGQKKIKEIKK